MRYTIFHRTAYRYDEPVHESHTVLHLQPRSDLTQYCTQFALDVTPRARLFSYADRFGNDVQHFAVLPEHDTLEIVARSYVVTARGEGPAPAPVPRALLDGDPQLADPLRLPAREPLRLVRPGARRARGRGRRPARGDDVVDWYRAPPRRYTAASSTTPADRGAHHGRRVDPAAARGLPGLRPRAGRALPPGRHPGPLT